MLIVFDIDGTLTRTMSLDGQLYAETFHAHFGVPLPTRDWARYRHVTDSGIAHEALASIRDRNADPLHLAAFRTRFVTALSSLLATHEASLEVPGAAVMLRRLREAGHAVAIATGSWQAAARAKLHHAGIDVSDVPLATSDDHMERERILETAIARAGGPGRHDRVVYVGDAEWDVAATRRLGIPLVGVDHENSGRLAALGVRTVVSDYSDAGAFMRALVNASVPIE